MKKISLFLSALIISFMTMAQGYEPLPDIILFDFDDVNPDLDWRDWVDSRYTEADTMFRVVNPVKDAVNSSEWVGEYHHRSPRQFEGVYFVNQPHSRIYNTLEFKYLIPPGQKGRVQYKFVTNSNTPDSLFNVTLYPTTTTALRAFEPREGDGAWHQFSVQIPSSNNIRAVAIGFNSEPSPGGKNPDNEEQVNPDLSGTICYFDDVRLKATESEFHTLYYEEFDTPTPYWVISTTNADAPQMNGGIQLVSSIDNLIFTQMWTDGLYDRYASFLSVEQGSHVDFYNIPVDGYNDYDLTIDYGYMSAGVAPYGIVTYMDISYRENGTEEWVDIESAEIAYDKFDSYYSPIRYEGMKAMDLRLSVDTAICKVHLNKVQITGAWDGGTSAVKPVKTGINAFYNAADQTLNVESDAKIEVFGLDGVLRAVSSNRPVFSVATLSRGVYIARITTEKGQTVLKFVR